MSGKEDIKNLWEKGEGNIHRRKEEKEKTEAHKCSRTTTITTKVSKTGIIKKKKQLKTNNWLS